MSTINQLTIRDLVEEAKKRIVVVVVCIVGLSYIMSLTSKSVWINLPAAASLIIILRYILLDLEMRRKAAAYNTTQSSESTISQKKPPSNPIHIEKPDWRKKVKSPPVEDAIDHFTRHLISEWVTDLWYSKLTPDKEGPEELVNIINGALGEIAGRLRNVNLIDLLTKDLIHLICTHFEQFRTTHMKMEKQKLGSLTIEHQDKELRRLLAAENKLHPALFSAESQHKVLQHLMDGLISFTFKYEDLQCLYFRYTGRELLASAVMRPILNLASPRFINERIEILVINMKKKKNNKGVNTEQETSNSKPDGSPRISADNFTGSLDPSVKGVELMQLKNDQSRTAANSPTTGNLNGCLSKDPLLSIDTQSSRSWSSLPLNSRGKTYDDRSIQRHNSGGEWGENLERFSYRKNQALAPENFENMWTKGSNYRKTDGENQFSGQVQQGSSAGKSVVENNGKVIMSKTNEKDTVSKLNSSENGVSPSKVANRLRADDTSHTSELNLHYLEEGDFDIAPYTSEEEETSIVTGLDSPGTKVWDGRSNRNPGISRIHHPLENSEGYSFKRTGKGHVQRRRRTQSDQKRSRLSSQKKMPVWQEVERTSFLSGDGQDILGSLKGLENASDSSDEYEVESLGRIHSGASASSSAPSSSILDAHSLTVGPLKNSLAVEPFFKMRCEVTGANIVKSGARTFAVYSISAMDINNNSWSVKRRFSHFEELHRCLKEYSEYNLHLPPKHFLSTGLDVPIILERCKLLDQYLKKLMQLPTISGSIEVWDFLSVDSQTYVFSNSFSIIETLSVDLDNKPTENGKVASSSIGSKTSPISLRREQLIGGENMEPPSWMKSNFQADVLTLKTKGAALRNSQNTIKGKESEEVEESPGSLLETSLDPTLPTEWVSPNVSVPILDLVDVIFQLQDGGWIRRQAFWVAKQVLHLGMGDALDDWLIDKIQILRKGSVIASIIRRIEQILWPDGIFISKHPKHKRPSASSPKNSPHSKGPTEISSPRLVDDEQKKEADRRAKFVYELMIDNAPAAIVGLIGRKEYEQCAKDLYFFIQSSVCLKQMTFELIELAFSSAFPELEHFIKQMHEEKHKFGEYKEE